MNVSIYGHLKVVEMLIAFQVNIMCFLAWFVCVSLVK